MISYEKLKSGQKDIFERFDRVLAQRNLAHAYLFSGGFLAYDMVLYLSQSLFCQESKDHRPCGHCRTCRLIAQEEFSDVTVLSPQGNMIKTETVRELVRKFSQSGFESGQQVFIIRDAEKMHANAANSLLKVMEEPQSAIHLFLLTEQEDLILPTVRSRTQIVSFPKNLPVMERFLEEGGLLKNQAQVLAQLASDWTECEVLLADKRLLDGLGQVQQFVSRLLSNPQQAYLLVPGLASGAADKSEQGRLIDMLSLTLAQQLQEKKAQAYLKHVSILRQMWQRNVSLQNALEYMILQVK
ncbi:DNA polymerase III subunit delta' [Streptococcus sp. DD13]|uniref:DNA polymerase III subunit delta' n=1 Tax=Streptococcus sp. DD13 TaxID=1777881 RepID=UPI0007988E63|nr:DNA polymerase III subunit delta' [Streptococcus sp. DD13]KXT78473.1 DNA polymerase III delta prime subunit [Streptococcus sp. DD13]